MKDIKTINKEREGRINLSQYKNLIDTIVKVEFQKISKLGLIELSDLLNLANYTVYYIISNSSDAYNDAYLIKAIKWSIRNELRRRYKWYVMKNCNNFDADKIKDAVYSTVLSIDEMADSENPTLIKDLSRTPEEKAEIIELKLKINEIMQFLPQREREFIEAKYFYDKKLKDMSEEFNISQSRISRIIQNGLNKIKQELLRQETESENEKNI